MAINPMSNGVSKNLCDYSTDDQVEKTLCIRVKDFFFFPKGNGYRGQVKRCEQVKRCFLYYNFEKGVLSEEAVKIHREKVDKMIMIDVSYPLRESIYESLSFKLVEKKTNSVAARELRIHNYDKKIYRAEILRLPREMKQLFLQIEKYLMFFQKTGLSRVYEELYLKETIEYLQGERKKKDISINSSNAYDFLNIIKSIDLAVEIFNSSHIISVELKSSYKLRERILLVGYPPISTCEAHTMALNRDNMRDVEYLKQVRSWVSPRVALHAKMCAMFFEATKALSVRLPCLIGLRGPSGSGKSTLIKKLMAYFNAEDMKGVMEQDAIKYILKMHTFLLNIQVQDEGSAVFKMLLEWVVKNTRLNYILDTRLLYLDTVKANLLRPAHERGVPVIIFDIDVPLITSLNRILIRKPFEKAPCVDFKPIIEGFKYARKERPKIIETLIQVGALYNLFAGTELVATIQEGQLQIFDKEAYKECLRVSEEVEIKQITGRVIDDNYIAEAIRRGDIRQEDEHMLKKWVGLGVTIEEAVKRHAKGE